MRVLTTLSIIFLLSGCGATSLMDIARAAQVCKEFGGSYRATYKANRSSAYKVTCNNGLVKHLTKSEWSRVILDTPLKSKSN
jgi:hypothetical protein